MGWKHVGLLVLAASTGCSSVKTTFMRLDAQGNLVEDPARCAPGIPAMIKVPTHLEVKIRQTDFWRIEQIGQSPKRLIPLPASTLRTVDISEVAVHKMVMIDPKRPVSGQGEFAIDYKDDGTGLLQKVNYKAADETLRNSAALATAALKVLGVSPTSSIGGAGNDLLEVTRTIAIARFPANQCSQPEIDAFVGQYINMCTPIDCNSPTAYAHAFTQ